MKCEICGSGKWIQRHHKFSQTKWARRIYGSLLDHPKNIQRVCSNCHAGHKSTKLIHWSERDFCQALGILAISKIGRMKI